MKIKGQAVVREYAVVSLPRYTGDIKLKVSSVPMGLQRMYETINPKPTPPVTVTQRIGKPAEKDADYDDPSFVKLFNE